MTARKASPSRAQSGVSAAGSRSAETTTAALKSVAASALTMRPYRDLKAGVAAEVVRRLERDGVLRRDDVRRIVADRTLDRRIAQGEALRIEEADGIVRLLRVRDHAIRVFDAPDLAEEWLHSPNPELDGEVPMTMAATDIGAREVEAVLMRIEHGVFG